MAHYLNEKSAQAPFASSAPMPTSPDTLLLDAWRRAEAATYVPKPILEVAPPPPDHQPLPPPTYSAVDRVMTDAVRVQITRAEARADAQSALAYEARSNLTSVQAELESERDANARLREELVRLRTKHQEETYKNTSLRRALKDAQEEASTMRKQRDHWHEGCERAVVGRDAAVRAAVALRELLRDAPGYTNGAAVELLRAQLAAAQQMQLQQMRTAVAVKQQSSPGSPPTAPVEAALAARLEALERQMQSLSPGGPP